MKIGCLAYLMLLLFIVGIVCLNGYCFDYALISCFGKDISFFIDCLAGTVTSAITLPTAIICLVLNYCGVPTPYFE